MTAPVSPCGVTWRDWPEHDGDDNRHRCGLEHTGSHRVHPCDCGAVVIYDAA